MPVSEQMNLTEYRIGESAQLSSLDLHYNGFDKLVGSSKPGDDSYPLSFEQLEDYPDCLLEEHDEPDELERSLKSHDCNICYRVCESNWSKRS